MWLGRELFEMVIMGKKSVSYHFYDPKKGVNWLKNRLAAIDKYLEKYIKQCLW